MTDTEKAFAVVRDLAYSDPTAEFDGINYCVFCDADRMDDLKVEDHAKDCVWRRAKELL